MKHGGEFLPWEIQVEILSWLPVKTLMQLRCVCKSWKSLISNNKLFKKIHLHKSARNKHFLLTLREDPQCYDLEDEDHCLVPCPVRRLVEDPSSMIDEDGCCNLEGKYRVIDSCNGLVCFRYTWGYDCYPGSGRCRFQFWNPATRLWSKMSPTLTMKNMRFGFGYDDSLDTYKVVGITGFNRCEEWQWATMVYCMGDSCLREISSKPSFGLSLMGNKGQFAGGCLNWLAVDELKNPNQNQRRALVILSFDMRKETYRSLSLHEDISDVKTHLSVLGNCLCLFQDRKGTHFDVWQMRDYGVRESWTRLVSVSYEHLETLEPLNCLLHLSWPLMWLSEDGDILMLIRNKNWDVILYNLSENSVKYVQLPHNKHWFCAHGYVKSLVSPYLD